MNAVTPLRPPVAPATASPEAGRQQERVRLQDYPIVASGPAGDPRLTVNEPQLRERLCLLSNDAGEYVLLVSKAHKDEHAVMSYETRLRRLLKINARVAHCTPDVIARAYATGHAASDAKDDTAERQWMLRILSAARDKGAQDVKFVVMANHCRVRYLISGRGYNLDPLSARDGWKLVRTLGNSMADLSGQSKTSLNERIPQDGNLKTAFVDALGLAGVRISTRPEGDAGIQVTLRLQPKEGAGKDFRESGYTANQVAQLHAFTENQQGMVIVAGKTGSGKSTLLKKLLEQIDVRERGELDIMTVEDPIEARMVGYDSGPGGRGGGIVQTPLVTLEGENPTAAWTRDMASLMRHAPRIIMPGELRDPASARTAFDIAMSGHLGMTTFHAFTAEGILLRLDQWGIDRGMLLNPSLVVGLAHQSLVRRLCDACKVPLGKVWNTLDPINKARYRAHTPVDGVFVAGTDPACPKCGGSGTKGRLVSSEIITPTIRFMDVYRERGALEARLYWMRDMDGLTRTEHVKLHIAAGMVDPRHADQDVDPLDKESNLLEAV